MNAINDRTAHTTKSKHHGGQERLSRYPRSFYDIYKWQCVRQGSSLRLRRTGTIETGWCSKVDVPKGGIRHTRTRPRRQPNSSSSSILGEKNDVIRRYGVLSLLTKQIMVKRAELWLKSVLWVPTREHSIYYGTSVRMVLGGERQLGCFQERREGKSRISSIDERLSGIA
jgi:hypothetical protein